MHASRATFSESEVPFKKFKTFFEKPPVTDPKLNKGLDPLFGALGHPADKDELKSLKDRYPSPDNAKNLVTPRTNPEILSL